MIGYKDITWCRCNCANMECHRNEAHLEPGGREHDAFVKWGGVASIGNLKCENFQEETDDDNVE